MKIFWASDLEDGVLGIVLGVDEDSAYGKACANFDHVHPENIVVEENGNAKLVSIPDEFYEHGQPRIVDWKGQPALEYTPDYLKRLELAEIHGCEPEDVRLAISLLSPYVIGINEFPSENKIIYVEEGYMVLENEEN